ncbi:nucleoside triphosphate pyrophosphohydrolase [Micromonospora parastrephiae]|uniref:nucleoside triphosphate pyrophosphohydrolase n=1 Tax=Micromonospora parastrephiae TaxID=2806101 RepID=UPI0028149764|nr:nucleoside triphosphate pyrophosphohydrolase [Micromonospora parastrephiae]
MGRRPSACGADRRGERAVHGRTPGGCRGDVVDGPATQRLLDTVAEHGTAVWLAGPAGDEALARELGLRLAREPGLAEMELMYGSWDPPGARLLDAVAVLDRLASPGGDPWKRAQTHRSLAGYLLEESYEAYDAISADDTDALREELGDVLLQVVLHARLAEELPEGERWTIDDVAGGLVDKMIRRNPHVFADAEAGTLEEITANWERIKRAEKARESVLDGVALSQPALALAAQILGRAARIGLAVPPPLADSQVDPEARLGASLLATVAAARQANLDPEAALRRATLAYAEAVRAAESPPASADPR